MALTFEQEDEDEWVIKRVNLPGSLPPVSLDWNGEAAPSTEEIENLEKFIANIHTLFSSSAELILENYSYDHFKELGISEDKLVEETAEAVSAVITLKHIRIYDLDGGEFELSFIVPWDPHHSFDVEYEENKAECCSVNG